MTFTNCIYDKHSMRRYNLNNVTKMVSSIVRRMYTKLFAIFAVRSFVVLVNPYYGRSNETNLYCCYCHSIDSLTHWKWHCEFHVREL